MRVSPVGPYGRGVRKSYFRFHSPPEDVIETCSAIRNRDVPAHTLTLIDTINATVGRKRQYAIGNTFGHFVLRRSGRTAMRWNRIPVAFSWLVLSSS